MYLLLIVLAKLFFYTFAALILSTRKNPCTNTRDPLKHRRDWEDELGVQFILLARLTPSPWNNWFRNSFASLVQWWGANLYSVSEICYCRNLMPFENQYYLMFLLTFWSICAGAQIVRQIIYLASKPHTKLTHKGLISTHILHHEGTWKFCNPSSLHDCPRCT